MKLIIIGSGGHAGVVIDAVRESYDFDIEGLMDETVPVGTMRHGFSVQHGWDFPEAYRWFIAIGDNAVREKFSKSNLAWTSIAHPDAAYDGGPVSTGTFLAANSFIGNNSTVGNFCIINTGAILEHDSSVGDYSHLCPGVVTGGRVKIGSRTTVGLGAMIRDGVTIGDNCTIGMGSVVLHDVPDNSTAWGNP